MIKSKTMLAVLAALALSASSAFASNTQLARHGADDLVPPPACDDHGMDNLCAPAAKAAASLFAKNGADDLAPVDDNGVDFVIAKHGADDGVDPIDDNGVDFIAG